MRKRFAIVGAGFSGLALAWHLLAHPKQEDGELTLFDPQGIGGGTSGLASGLLHPYSGARVKLNRLGREGMSATLKLLYEASKESSHPLYRASGVLRTTCDQVQVERFWEAKKHDPTLKLLPSNQLFIPYGLTVYPKRYLKALWHRCEKKGAKLEKRKIASLKELENFSATFLCVGGHFPNFPELASLGLKRTKGQTIDYLCKHPLSLPIISDKYLVMDPEDEICIAGSTYERNFADEKPDLQLATQEIAPRAILLFPKLLDCPIVGGRAGLRASTSDHLPLVRQVQDKAWALTGMGSKGLLYHALMAEKMVEYYDAHCRSRGSFKIGH